jgi:hypothetical protein
MRFARIDALLTWVYAAMFGLPAIPIAIHHVNTGGLLPRFLDLFEVYGGPWSDGLGVGAFAALLIAWVLVLTASAFTAWLVWRGSRLGAILSLVLLPVEMIFWFGFALPVPWAFGIARVVLVALAWRSLTPGGVGRERTAS